MGVNPEPGLLCAVWITDSLKPHGDVERGAITPILSTRPKTATLPATTAIGTTDSLTLCAH